MCTRVTRPQISSLEFHEYLLGAFLFSMTDPLLFLSYENLTEFDLVNSAISLSRGTMTRIAIQEKDVNRCSTDCKRF